jgi:hypothetical protein
MPKEIPPVLQQLGGLVGSFAKRLAESTVTGAAEGLLDEVQGVLRKADSHIAGARGKAAARRREREKGSARDPKIEVTVVDVDADAVPKRRKR